MANVHEGRKLLTRRALVSLLLAATYISSVTCVGQHEGLMKEDRNNSTPIKCYQCNSWSDEGCANLKVNDTDSLYLHECRGDYEGDEPFCRKTVQAIKGHATRVIRSCGWMRHIMDCYHTDDDHHVENVCQCYTDACNLASSNRDAALAFTATLVAVITLMYSTSW